MCLGIPGRIEKIEGDYAQVSYGELRGRACVSLIPSLRVGDFVIVHAGFAIEKVDEAEARETLSLLSQIGGTPPT